NTVTQACRRRAVVENMPEVGLTATTLNFGSLHAMCMIGGIDYTSFTDGLIKTWPATSALEFGIAFKKRVSTRGAIISANIFKRFELACPGPFRTLHTRDIINIFRENFFPFLFTHHYFTRIRFGINGII